MDMDRFIGRLLDNRYEILEVIGTGGMAVVYKARCHRLNRLVAIKILKDEYSQDEEFRRRFHAESHAVAMLSHSNIVSVYDVSTADDADYIVMELIDGITLKQYMEKKGTLNWKETLHFAIQIAKALEHAHGRGIIHRDIKPHNVMVLKNGSVKVTDFGIARVMSKSNTLTKEALGSVHYISPEQARGGRVDNCSDLYSLGVVMYEMMTGRPPYDGESPVAVAIQHINGKAAMPSTLNPNIPGGLEQIIMKAMANAPADRYPTAAAMLHDMDEFRKNPAILFDFNNPDMDVDAALLLTPKEQEKEETMILPKAPAEQTAERAPQPRPARPKPAEKPQPSRKPSRQREEIVEDESEEGSKVALVAIVACALVALVAIGMFVWMLFGSEQSDEYIYVPNLVGMTEEQLASVKDFEVVVLSEQKYSSEYRKGTVMEQDPAMNTRRVKGSKIWVTISRGSKASNAIMENLTGKTLDEATEYLGDLEMSLNLVIKEVQNSTIEAGKIIDTEPSANQQLTKGQTVTLYVSVGTEVKLSRVPKLEGQTMANAIMLLRAAGFENYTFEEVESKEPKNTIVGQSVAANEQISVTTTIVLQVSLGYVDDSDEDEPILPTIPEIDPELVYKVITVDVPENAKTEEEYWISIWYEDQMLDEQLVAEGAVSVQFEVAGKEKMTFTVKFNDESSSQIEVDFDE